MKLTKDDIQLKAETTWEEAGRRGTIAMATGTGKSKIFINRLKKQEPGDYQAFLAVPTEAMRDYNWRGEFAKWGALEIFDKHVLAECYASMHKIKGHHFKIVCLDEGHRLTPLSFQFFQNNTIEEIIVLTATPPKKLEKIELLSQIAPIVFSYSLQEAVDDGIVSPFVIKVVQTYLDNTERYLEVGTGEHTYMQTEYQRYRTLTNSMTKLKVKSKAYKHRVFERARVIYNSISKTKLAEQLIATQLQEPSRGLIFCGSIAQATKLCPYSYHSGNKNIPATGDTYLKQFKNLEINKLSCVQSLNEGMDLPMMDKAIVTQVKRDELHLIQQIGRIIRFREDHQAEIWLIQALYTSDEEWVNNALLSFDSSIITYYSQKSLETNEIQIN